MGAEAAPTQVALAETAFLVAVRCSVGAEAVPTQVALAGTRQVREDVFCVRRGGALFFA